MYPGIHIETPRLEKAIKMNRDYSSQAAANTQVFENQCSQSLNPESNPAIEAIGVKKWNRLSKSTQAIIREITKLIDLDDDFPGCTLTGFNSADYDRFVRDGERLLCGKNLTLGFKVKNDPFSIDPGIMVYTRSYEFATVASFVRECFMEAVNLSIRSPGLCLQIHTSGVDIPLPGGGGIFEPENAFIRAHEMVPHFIVEVKKYHTMENARRQVICPMEQYRGTIRGGMLLYFSENAWRAEVYRYVNRTTGGDDIIIPDGIENQERERFLMKEALNSSDSDFAIYLQENRAYTLLSNDSPCEDVPLSMFDLFDKHYEHVAVKESLRHPDATFWLHHSIFAMIYSGLPPGEKRIAVRPRGN